MAASPRNCSCYDASQGKDFSKCSTLGPLQIWGSLQHKSVQALATLDEKLEQTPLLEKLTPQEMPDEVTDSSGELTQDCNEVILQAIVQQLCDMLITLSSPPKEMC